MLFMALSSSTMPIFIYFHRTLVTSLSKRTGARTKSAFSRVCLYIVDFAPLKTISKKKKGELGNILNTFDVEKLTDYMKTTDLFKASFKDNFLKSDEERRIMFMCFMIADRKAPANVYPVTKRKAKELISKKFMEEQFKAAKKKVDEREENGKES